MTPESPIERECTACNASMGELLYLEWTQQAFMCDTCRGILHGYDSPTEDEDDAWFEEYDPEEEEDEDE